MLPQQKIPLRIKINKRAELEKGRKNKRRCDRPKSDVNNLFEAK
jgi:hypothetical protein